MQPYNKTVKMGEEEVGVGMIAGEAGDNADKGRRFEDKGGGG
jgi:hypothetical protein